MTHASRGRLSQALEGGRKRKGFFLQIQSLESRTILDDGGARGSRSRAKFGLLMGFCQLCQPGSGCTPCTLESISASLLSHTEVASAASLMTNAGKSDLTVCSPLIPPTLLHWCPSASLELFVFPSGYEEFFFHRLSHGQRASETLVLL